MVTTWTNVLNGAATTVGATPGDAVPATLLADVLQISNSGTGLDTTLRDVGDGDGTTVPLKVSTSAVMLPNAAIWPYGDSTFFSAGMTGILIPYYIYPNNPYSDTTVARLLGLIRQYRGRVPVIVVVNPNSGPGSVMDGNWAAFIKLCQAAGAKVAGYVSTAYAVTAEAVVKADVDTWLTLYADTPVDTIFFDEQTYDLGTNNANVALYKRYTDYCHARNLAPVIANPGTNQREEYFAERTADIIVTAETGTWPSESDMLGGFIGGHIDYKTSLRAALVYGQTTLVPALVEQLAKYVQWLYVTDDALSPNPWDSLATHLEQQFALLGGKREVNVRDFGAIGNLTANDTTAIQNAIDSITVSTASRVKGGVVFFPPGTYRVSSPIELPEFVTLQGSGTEVTIIYLSNNANCDVVKTIRFDTLTGTGNGRLNTAGVPCQFGIRDLMIHANRFNNVAGTTTGLKIYGYNFIIDNVMVYAASLDGVYVEHGLGTDPYVQQPTNQIECHVSNLKIRDCTRYGLNWLGPTDACIHSVMVAYSGSDGVRFDRTAYGTAAVYARHIHSFANGGRSVWINCPIRGGQIIGETAAQEGVYITSQADGCHIEFLEAYSNDTGATGTYYQAYIEAGATGVTIGQAQIACKVPTAIGGMYIAGDACTISNALVQGVGGFAGICYNVAGSQNHLKLTAMDASTGNTGLVLTGNDNLIDCKFEDAYTAVAHSGATTGNNVRVSAELLPGGTLLSGVAFGATETYHATDGVSSAVIQSGQMRVTAPTGKDAILSFENTSAHSGAGTYARMGIEAGDTSAFRMWVPTAATGVAVLGLKYDDDQWTISCANGVRLVVGSDGALYHQGSLRKFLDLNTHQLLRSYSLATLPSAATSAALIYVSDLTGGAEPCFSDGTNWRKFSDRSIAA